MHILLMACPAGDGRASRFVCADYGAHSPDLKRSVKLPPTLENLWAVLCDHPNQTVSYLALTRAFWPGAVVASPRTVQGHLWRLRVLLTEAGWPSDCLETVEGRGVRFRPPSN